MGIGAKNKLDSLFFTQLFVSERKQIALMADANLIFAPPLCDKSLRNGEYYGKKSGNCGITRKGKNN